MELTIQNHVQTEPEASICVGIIETQSGISCLCRELRKCPAWIWGQKIRPMRPRLPQTFLIAAFEFRMQAVTFPFSGVFTCPAKLASYRFVS